MHQVHTDEILFIEAFGNYTKVYFENEMIVSHEKISSFEALLPSEIFLRIHKSFIVATTKIKLIDAFIKLVSNRKFEYVSYSGWPTNELIKSPIPNITKYIIILYILSIFSYLDVFRKLLAKIIPVIIRVPTFGTTIKSSIYVK